jgi:hypothetical protein
VRLVQFDVFDDQWFARSVQHRRLHGSYRPPCHVGNEYIPLRASAPAIFAAGFCRIAKRPQR